MGAATRKNQCYPGERYGRLVVVEPAGKNNNYEYKWLCQCDCGGTSTPTELSLKRRVFSCGCLRWEALALARGKNSRTHGMTVGKKTPEYRCWTAMKTRCLNPNNPSYPRWGGRGISICPQWVHSFEQFLADMGPRPTGTSLDRWPDMNGNYEPSNCRWATATEQARNSRKVKLTADVRRQIDSLLQAGLLQREVGEKLNISQGAISNYVVRKTWREPGQERLRRRRPSNPNLESA